MNAQTQKLTKLKQQLLNNNQLESKLMRTKLSQIKQNSNNNKIKHDLQLKQNKTTTYTFKVSHSFLIHNI